MDNSDTNKDSVAKSPPKKRSTGKILFILFCAFLLCGGCVALLLPNIECARESHRRVQCQNRMRQFGIALLGYQAAHEFFPSYSDPGNPGYPPCSWRVQTLPWVEQEQLFKRYDRKQPWDSPTNLALEKDPWSLYAYKCPSNPNIHSTESDFLSIVGPKCVFREKGNITLDDITDGAANTIMLVESVDSGIHWMEPRDLKFDDARIVEYDSKDKGIRSHHIRAIHATFCDGSVKSLSDDIDPELLKALITINGGESVESFR